METKNPVQSAERIFQVMETLSETGAITLTELSGILELHKSTVHRLLTSLICMGYVRQDENTGKYMLTFKILKIAGRLLDKDDIYTIAHPYIKKLVEISGETVHLVQREGTNIVYIDKVESRVNSIRMVSRIGMSHPMYCTGVGKAILATLSEGEVREIWEASLVEKMTEHTIVSIDEFLKALEEVREQGYALDNEENEEGVRCIAACILNHRGKANNAFSISGPVSRMTDERIEKLEQYVLKTKNDLSKELGYTKEQ